jgi:hypothetical protein
MDNQPLDPVIEEKARALCAQITVAHDLDSEIQEELYGHVEDKILGYLSGEVPVTGDDALILVREHFGDAATIKSLLQDVHAVEATMSQWRRYAAAAAVTLCCIFIARVAQIAATVGLHYYNFTRIPAAESANADSSMLTLAESGAMQPLLFVPLFLALSGVMFLGLWVVLIRWQRRFRNGERPWYYRWTPWKMAALLFAFVLLHVTIPSMPLGMSSSRQLWHEALTMGAGVVLIVSQCVAWIWWCDAPPRSKRNSLNAACAWALAVALLSAVPVLSAQINTVAESAPYGVAENRLVHGQFFDTVGYWSLWSSKPSNMLIGGAIALVAALLIGSIASGIYDLTVRLRKRRRGGGIDNNLSAP